tara:strand:- start:328 stop:435 length:108 start_codon:yes stop_codon:yes gene_type:complete
MDILIPVGIIILVIGYAVKKLKPELWKKTMSKFKK